MMMMQVKGLCGQDTLRGGTGQTSIQVSRDIPRETLRSQLPKLTLHFRREGVTLDLRDYLRKCTSAKHQNNLEDWCSILSESSSDNYIHLGTAFLRDYLITFDGT